MSKTRKSRTPKATTSDRPRATVGNTRASCESRSAPAVLGTEQRHYLIQETDSEWTKELALTNEEFGFLAKALKNYRTDQAIWAAFKLAGKRESRDLFGQIPLRFGEMDSAAETELRRQLLREVEQRIAAFSVHRLYDVASCVEALENERGCMTPSEEFVSDIVGGYGRFGLTPADAAHALEEFRENFDSMERDCRWFMSQHAAVIQKD